MVAVVLGRVPEALEVREVRCVVVDVVERRVDIEQLDRKRILAERADDERLELAWAHHVSVLEHLVQPREDTIDVFMCLADRVAYRVGDLADDSLLVQVGHVRKRGFPPLRRDAVDLCAVGRDGGAGESIGCKSAVNQLFARGGPRDGSNTAQKGSTRGGARARARRRDALVTRARDARVTAMGALIVIAHFRRFRVARVRTPGRDHPSRRGRVSTGRLHARDTKTTKTDR